MTTKFEIINLLKTRDVAVARALVVLNDRQTADEQVAEATKIIENTFRDINIAYVNELAKSFDAMGIDLIETIKASSNKPFALFEFK